MKVERRKYRFRFLNASNARVYEMRLSNRQKMAIVGTDTWLLPRAVEVESFEIAQGQRQDVIIDFRGAPDEVYIENIMVQTDGRKGRGVEPNKRGDLLMKFQVYGPNHSEASDPRVAHNTVIRGFKGIDPGGQWAPERENEIVATRHFTLDRSNGGWTIDNRFFNPRRADAVPELGYGAERWIVENKSGGWWHPLHTHLEGMQTRTINGRLPRLERRFNCDLVELHDNEKAEVFIKFRTFTGPYVFHCHAVEHEDMRMMAVVDPTPGARGGGFGGIDPAPPLDAETPIHSDVSGVVPDCTQLEEEHRIYFEAVGDHSAVDGRGVGFPNCEFDRTLRGNQ
jgi:FtsP/CotA-like multicopper oxidase with cupredoxin domain